MNAQSSKIESEEGQAAEVWQLRSPQLTEKVDRTVKQPKLFKRRYTTSLKDSQQLGPLRSRNRSSAPFFEDSIQLEYLPPKRTLCSEFVEGSVKNWLEGLSGAEQGGRDCQFGGFHSFSGHQSPSDRPLAQSGPVMSEHCRKDKIDRGGFVTPPTRSSASPYPFALGASLSALFARTRLGLERRLPGEKPMIE
jgi:hypothetical protein